MTCSFVMWQRFPSNWKPAANTSVLLRLELVTPLRQVLGSHAAIFLTTLQFENLIKILFSRPYKVFLSFTLFPTVCSFLEPFKDSFSADRLMSFFLTLSSFSQLLDSTIRHGNVSFFRMCSLNTLCRL